MDITKTVLNYIECKTQSLVKEMRKLDRTNPPQRIEWIRLKHEYMALIDLKEHIDRVIQLEESRQKLLNTPEWHWSRNLNGG